MTLRYAMVSLGVLGSIMVAGSCASASPALDARPLLVDQAAGYELEVLVDGLPAPTYAHGNGTYVLGQLGERYTLRVINHTGRRIEAVVSVDGRDVVDGRPADYRSKRGYLVPAWGHIDIDGWRLSTTQAAAFRFSTVSGSYAARTGSARDVGVIGAAIFPERVVPRPVPRVLERPYPQYAPESRMRDKAQPAPAPSDAAGASVESEGAGGPPAPRAAAPAPQYRPGLGTEFGEAVSSPVEEVAFVRANAARPAVLLGVRYDDRAGLIAMGIDVDRDGCYGVAGYCDSETSLRETASPFPAADRRFAAPPPCWGGRACR